MKKIIIQFILDNLSPSDKYTKESLENLPDENLIEIAFRIEAEKSLAKSKPVKQCCYVCKDETEHINSCGRCPHCN